MRNCDFQCTQCGDCCRGFRLPLSVEEAPRWLQDGHRIEVLCEAIPWVDEPPPSDRAAQFKRERSFATQSGTLPIRVLVTLAAPLGDGCPNLAPDQRCSIYERRPRACRIYPAEFNPLLEFAPERRRCPPEAWRAGSGPFIRQGAYVDPELRVLVRDRLKQAVDDVPTLRALCETLGIGQAALANEGYVAHSPDAQDLIRALSSTERRPAPSPSGWTFVSDQAETVEAIRSCGGQGLPSSEPLAVGAAYLSLFGNR
jgi:Fe-S-cluster containining protein